MLPLSMKNSKGSIHMRALIAAEYVTLDGVAGSRNHEIAEAWTSGGAIIVGRTTLLNRGGE
jgi:hypothetical protein